MSKADGGRTFEALLEYLSSTRGFDFRGYKRATLIRRFERRLQVLGITDFQEYMDHLEVHPGEFTDLFNTILINVTSFFRDPASWKVLAETIIPKILSEKDPDDQFRAWTAGCATGEETYSLAMTLAEILGPTEYADRVKIYASDIDEDALAQARTGTYDVARLTAVPPELHEKYFENVAGRRAFRMEYRRAIVFGRHNVVRDAPISRLDLLVCRNTLMYFNAETQAEILRRFRFAVRPDGYLFLGRAEMLVANGALFQPFDLHHRLFRRSGRAPALDGNGAPPVAPMSERPLVPNAGLRDTAIESSPIATMVVDREGALQAANIRARVLFGMKSSDLGRPFSEVAISSLSVDLRSLFQSVCRDGQPVMLSDVQRRADTDEVQYLRVYLYPLREEHGDLVGVAILADDISYQHRLVVDLERAQRQLDVANEQIQSTTGDLQTTNEELQSSNEELETTNEELQSANEELETMNEELQSTNEELETTNEELRQRGQEADQANAFLQSILTGLSSGVVVVDRDGRVQSWSERSEDLWGLRSDEVVGRLLSELDIGLPVDLLVDKMRGTMRGPSNQETMVVDATNRRGKHVQCRVTLTPLLGNKQSREGLILLVEELTEKGREKKT